MSVTRFFDVLPATILYAMVCLLSMVCACCFVNKSGQAGLAVCHTVASGLGHTSKGLPEATIGCEVLLRRHSGRRTPRDSSQELPSIGKVQSPYGSCHATYPVCFCIALSLPTVLCDRL